MPFTNRKLGRTLTTLMATAAVIVTTAVSAVAGMGERFSVKPGAAFNQTRVYWIDSHQDVTVSFSLAPDGKAQFHSRYSNGKKADGDHFYAKVVLLDGSGRIISETIAGVGLNGSGIGRTNVAFRDISFTLPPEYRAAVRAVRYEAGHSNTRDDEAFWENARKIAETIIGTSSAGAVIYGQDGLTDLPALKFE